MENTGKDKYLIGDVSRICNVPKKTLRYYDSIGIIKPEQISEFNSYRYYSSDNMYDIIVLKYFKQMGYSLDEIRKNLCTKDLNIVLNGLMTKVEELERAKKVIENEIYAALEWKSLISEGESVRREYTGEISIKEYSMEEYCCLNQSFNYDYKSSIINISWSQMLETNKEEIKGPVIIKFDSFYDKKAGIAKRGTILQKGMSGIQHNIDKIKFGGKFLSIYHVGDYSNIEKTYEKLESFIKENDVKVSDEVFERYVVDYWTTNDKTLFVTEILLPLL